MRKNKTPMFFAVVFLLIASAANIFAQQEKGKDFIKIEINVKSESFSHTARVPVINNSSKNYSPRQDEIYLQNIRVTECFDCVFDDVEIFSSAFRLDENSSEVHLFVGVRNKKECSLEDKKFVVKRGKRKEFKSKCGVKISAYYE